MNIELDRYEIYYSTNDCQMNNKSHDFYSVEGYLASPFSSAYPLGLSWSPQCTS